MKKLPKTQNRRKKRMQDLLKNEITTPEQAQEYALSMLDMVKDEMDRLKEYCKENENQLAQELLDRYRRMESNWKTRLKYVEKKLK